jgi:hypothetical protein
VQSFASSTLALSIIVIVIVLVGVSIDVIGLREACSVCSRCARDIETSKTTAAVNVGRGRERRGFGRMMDTQVVFVPFFAMAPEPALGNGTDEATTSGEVEVLGSCVSETVNGIGIRRVVTSQ